MNIFNPFKKKPKSKAEPYTLHEVKPNIIEKMSEKPVVTKFINVDLESPQGSHIIPSKVSKMTDTDWMGKHGSYGIAGISGSTGYAGTGITGSTGSSSAAAAATQWMNSYGSYHSPLPQPKKKIDDKSGIPIKISLNTIIDHPDLVYIGKSKIDGYPLYRFTGADGKLLAERYPVEELFDATEILKKTVTK